MQNKKTIILGIIAIALLTGVVWYASKNKDEIANQAASILNTGKDKQQVTESDGEFIIGDPNAPVTIIEYSSHLCGACSNFHKVIFPLIVNDYVKTGKVKIIPRSVSHPALTVAVLCGQEQNSFSEVNEYIFENVNEIKTTDDIKAVAGKLGLDQETFSQCFDSGDKYEDQIMKWFEQGETDEVENTPTFLINGQKIVGVQPYDIFKKAIEQELSK